jgi:hypothetical protein
MDSKRQPTDTGVHTTSLHPEDRDNRYQQPTWERAIAVFLGVVIVITILYLVIRNEPFRDPNLVVLTRIILALATAICGATVPGFLNVSWNRKGVIIRAGGALALFVLTLLLTPKVVTVSDSAINRLLDRFESLSEQFDKLRTSLDKRSSTGEEKRAIVELYDKRAALRDKWRDLYQDYAAKNRASGIAFSRSFEAQTIRGRMEEVARDIEGINSALAELERKDPATYKESHPPLPPTLLDVSPEH